MPERNRFQQQNAFEAALLGDEEDENEEDGDGMDDSAHQ